MECESLVGESLRVSIKHSGEEVDARFGYKILELVKFPGVG